MRRLLVFASAIVLVETLFFAALSPLLPAFSSELGLSKAESGILVAMYALGGIAGAVPAGWMSSRIGIKTTAITGLLLLTVACIGFGLVSSYALLNATRFAQGFAGALCWNAAFAWLLSSTPRERRGETIGIAMSAAIAGALLGPVLGAAASAFGRAETFGAMAALSTLLAVWAAWMPAPRLGEIQPMRILLVAVRTPRVAAGMWLLMLPALLFGTLQVLAPLSLDSLGWGAFGIAATFFLSAALEAVLNPSIGRWSDRKGRLAPIRLGLISAAAVTLTIPWIGDKWLLSLFVVLAGIAYGLFWAPSTALLSDGWEAVGVGHGLGFTLMNLAWAPGNVVGSTVAGGLADVAGDAAAYSTMAALCIGTFLALRRVAARRLTATAKTATSG